MPAFAMRKIVKRFPGVVANNDVDLTIEAGEIHALLGENGAGKSTLMQILYGFHSMDSGSILIDGEPVEITSPKDAIALDIGMVHQEFMLVRPFSVAENTVLGLRPGGGAEWSVNDDDVCERTMDDEWDGHGDGSAAAGDPTLWTGGADGRLPARPGDDHNGPGCDRSSVAGDASYGNGSAHIQNSER